MQVDNFIMHILGGLDMFDHTKCLTEAMFRHIGRTVTIFTTTGGLSGNGFTGVLLCVDPDCVRLLTDIGAPPACPVGSACENTMTPMGIMDNERGFCGNPLGAVCVIPTCAIAVFTHSAI
jgi:hypothetical protein